MSSPQDTLPGTLPSFYHILSHVYICCSPVTESDSGFMDSNQIPVFQGLGIDLDQFLGILEMIRQGFTQIFSEICEVL